MKKILFAATILLCLYSCGSKKQPIPLPESSTVDSSKNNDSIDSFFPVTEYLKGQMLAFDSIPVTPLKINYKNGQQDSVWIKRDSLKWMLQAFTQDEIGKGNLLSFFKVTKFNDQTINAITFTYDPIKPLPDSIRIRHWNMYVQPETGAVSKIYIVKQIKENGKNVTQQLTWQANTAAKITTLFTKPDGNIEIVTDQKFVWAF
jgi:hypothetical protein